MLQKRYITLFFTLLFPVLSFSADIEGHQDPVASVIFWVTLIFFFGVIGRYIARYWNQAGVLGELLMGVLVGNLCYYFGMELIVVLREGPAIFTIMREVLNGIPLPEAVHIAIPSQEYANQVTHALDAPNGIELLKVAYIVDIFSRYGVIFLLFMVGLESSVEELKHTGKEAVQVAILGVVAPIILGLLVAYFMMPSASFKASLFVAATLCATSVGITARVLVELKKLRTREAHTILGAAMIDDILGLVILAVVSSIVINGNVDIVVIAQVITFSVLFLMGAFIIGPKLIKFAIWLFRSLDVADCKLIISFITVMSFAYLATVAQLATIIGAFAAGLILNDQYFSHLKGASNNALTIRNLVSPLESILAPLFFMMIGIQVKIETFFHWEVIILALGLTTAAVLGKLISGIGANKKDNRLLIGIGMLPRGEVGLVFASIGRTLGVMSDQLFTAIVLMVIITTFAAPPLLKAQYKKTPEKAV